MNDDKSIQLFVTLIDHTLDLDDPDITPPAYMLVVDNDNTPQN
tara:strand:+ start:3482 stop:3610 length:129 start_codon:yes stop_codon:yes gene_type:complete